MITNIEKIELEWKLKVEIDKGIPIPKKEGTSKTRLALTGDTMPRLPFWEMEKGDSFFLPGVNERHIRFLAMTIAKMMQPFRKMGRAYVIKRSWYGVRCWRRS